MPRLPRRSRWVPPVLYLAGALLLTWRLWPAPAHTVVAGGDPHDTDLYTWYLAYAAHAVAHAHLPDLTTTVQNFPAGINLTWNTSVVLPGVLFAPLTLAAGPVVTYAVLLVLGFAGSAWAAYGLLRRLACAPVPAALGGALYGFSPAAVHSGLGHLALVLGPALPLLVRLTVDLATGRRAWLGSGLLLGLLVTAQLLVGEELLLFAALGLAVVLVVLALSRPRAVRARVGPLVLAALTTLVVVLVLSGAFLLAQFAGPLTQHGSPFTTSYFTNDLRAFVRPSQRMLLHTSDGAVGHVTGPAEYLAYLGLPLLVLALVVAVLRWRDLRVRCAAVTGLVLALLSLGATVTSADMPTGLSGPWRLVAGLPVFEAALPDRFSLPLALAVAVLLAAALEAVRRRWLVVAVAVAALLPVVPVPYDVARLDPLPAGLTDGRLASALPAGRGSVVVLPFPTATSTEPLRWQAAAHFAYAMPGGFFLGPAADGHAYVGGSGPRPTAQLFEEVASTGVVPALDRSVRSSFAVDLAYWHARAVVLGPGEHEAALRTVVEALLGPGRQVRELTVWSLT